MGVQISFTFIQNFLEISGSEHQPQATFQEEDKLTSQSDELY
jgi:hypothetical protein